MATVIVRHKVKDYKTWKPVFDKFVDARRAGGEKSYQIFHLDDQPNNILAIVDYDSLDNARKFFSSPKLKEEMGKGGVLEQPDIFYLKEYGSGTT